MSAGVPTLTAGTEVLGEYRGSGLTERTGLVRRYDGEVLQLTWIMYQVVVAIDGQRDLEQIAAQATLAIDNGEVMDAVDVAWLLEEQLAPLALVGDRPPVAPQRAEQLLGMRLRRQVLAAPAVHLIGGGLKWLFLPVVVPVVLLSWVAMLVWLAFSGAVGDAFVATSTSPSYMLQTLALVLACGVFHEFGHAAACRYGGARPGGIGVGIYIVWPSMFTEVTDSYRLSKAGRIRVDLGGVYFNIIASLLLFGAWYVTGYVPLLMGALLNMAEMLEQLLPVIRLDGYYLLADLVGVPDLFGSVSQTLRGKGPMGPLKRGARVFVACWAAVVFPLIALQLLIFIGYGPRVLRAVATSLEQNFETFSIAAENSDWATLVLSAVTIVFLILPWLGGAYMVWLIWRALRRMAHKALVRINDEQWRNFSHDAGKYQHLVPRQWPSQAVHSTQGSR